MDTSSLARAALYSAPAPALGCCLRLLPANQRPEPCRFRSSFQVHVCAALNAAPDFPLLQVRTKVFKCLGCVVEAESRVLSLPDVAAAVRAALDDDSVAVREATLELLAKLISTNPALAGEYFDVLVTASHVSVCLIEPVARGRAVWCLPATQSLALGGREINGQRGLPGLAGASMMRACQRVSCCWCTVAQRHNQAQPTGVPG